MALAVINTRARLGVEAPEVQVEVHLSKGLPSLAIVGMPEASVKESKDRVRSAILNSELSFPPQRTTINLAPADLPKEGSHFDLSVAIGILKASGQLSSQCLNGFEFIGELALGGRLKSVKGIIPMVIAAKKKQRAVFLPRDNFQEASLVESVELYPADNILDIVAFFTGGQGIDRPVVQAQAAPPDACGDLSDVAGQVQAKRALEIAAAGGHHVLMFGPPGTGKTMLARRFQTLLPAMTEDEAMETAAIRSIAGQSLCRHRWRVRPFVSPHHTASGIALVGGGRPPKPGAISLAHNGTLFLDEVLEFNRNDLEVLREPLESGEICIARAAWQVSFPAKFQLIAALNPCPCGYLTDPEKSCRCSPDQIRRYLNKISGPMLDRIDLQVEVNRLPEQTLWQDRDEESSILARSRVEKAVVQRKQRQAHAASHGPRSRFGGGELDDESQRFIQHVAKQMSLSPRVITRVIGVARTIADLAQSDAVTPAHLSEAISFRMLDRYLEQL